jgi:hypothetical protein
VAFLQEMKVGVLAPPPRARRHAWPFHERSLRTAN